MLGHVLFSCGYHIQTKWKRKINKMNAKQKAYRMNVMNLVKHHRKNCECEIDCGVSLLLLKQMAEEVGVDFTRTQLNKFL